MTETKKLPAELRETGLFCGWKYEERDGKKTKVPYNPRTGGRAQSTNPETFAPLSGAENAQVGYDGLGVGIFGSLGAIDIDHCINEDGSISDMAADIMTVMHSYSEKSPSGTGIRILFKATDFQYDKSRYYINNQKIGLEVYIAGCTNKYVTVTGNAIADGLEFAERSPQLRQILDKYMLRRQDRAAVQAPVSVGVGVDIEDAELIARIRRSKNGAVFDALWFGDTSAYNGDDSRADMAMCDILAFWTGCDASRMDKLFRQSGLMRDKWDRPTAGSTYGAITIREAIRTTGQVYDPQAHFKRKADKIAVETECGTVKLADIHPEKNDSYGWNDIGNGYLFADWYKDLARYVPERKKWYVYNGEVWRADTGNLMAMELCKQLADALVIYSLSLPDGDTKDKYRKFVEQWQRRTYRETILKDAASVYPVELARFDADPFLFNCKNGTLDLRTREFRPHSSTDLLSKMSGVKYDPDARCERWERFITEVMEGDRDKAAFLQKSLGLALTGDTAYECFFLLYGPKSRNGKGTAMETFMRLMGDYGRTAKPDTIAQRQTANGSGPSEDIARLAGARFVNIPEPDKRLILSSALVKTLTGNDTITARFLNENSFEFLPQFKLFINTNHLPAVTDVTLFSSGRVKVIPFERHFSENEQDHGLKMKLSRPGNLSGILNWCLNGFWLMRETGFKPPEAVTAATDKYRQDSDKISRFIADELEAGSSYEVRTIEAYERYKDWCWRNGFQPGSIKTWKPDMEALVTINDNKRPSSGGNPTKMIIGYRLKYPTNSSNFSSPHFENSGL